MLGLDRIESNAKRLNYMEQELCEVVSMFSYSSIGKIINEKHNSISLFLSSKCFMPKIIPHH